MVHYDDEDRGDSRRGRSTDRKAGKTTATWKFQKPGTAGPRTKRGAEIATRSLAPPMCTNIAAISWVDHVEIHNDEPAATACWSALVAPWGVIVKPVLSDNGVAYKSHLWRGTCRDVQTKAEETRPWGSHTNAEIERFHRPLVDGRAFKRFHVT